MLTLNDQPADETGEINAAQAFTMPVSGASAPVALPGLPHVNEIAVAGGSLYWARTEATQSVLGVSPLAGGAGKTIQVLPASYQCFALAALGDEVFAAWGVPEGIFGASLSTSASLTIPTDTYTVSGMAADDSGLYVLSETTPLSAWRPGDVQLTPLAAGTDGNAVGPLLDDQFVYWTTGGGKLMKTSKR